MAKRQNFIVGSTNDNTATLTPTELNTAWNRNALLESSVLDGTFNAVSDYSNDSSNEIANAIQSITGSEPTGETQTELAGALQQMRDEITTSSLRFVGYVATSAPSASIYALIEGNLWINASAMPTTFPVAASSIKQWNGSSWVNYDSTYTPSNFECWRNVNDANGYYWFGGQWTLMSTDMSVDYFTLNASGKWEIKSSINLPGAPTAATPPAANDSTRLATTAWVRGYAIAKNPANWDVGVKRGIAETSAPGDTYIPLTLGASGNTYEADSPGWLVLSCSKGSQHQYLRLFNQANHMTVDGYIPYNNAAKSISMYVNTGQTIEITYDVPAANTSLFVVLAKGLE